MLVKKKNKIILKLNKQLYDSRCIKEIFNEYAKEYQLEMKDDNTHINIELPKEKLAYEFASYVLELMKSKGIV